MKPEGFYKIADFVKATFKGDGKHGFFCVLKHLFCIINSVIVDIGAYGFTGIFLEIMHNCGL